jgi:bifunctional enzyme CysN/CysC
VDDGKSTLIGRLLFDSKSILTDQLAAIEEVSRRRGDGYVDLALLTDGLRAEREQGITIDVAYRFFSTGRRTFIIADTPGHELYTRNMVTGASTADLALILIDARNGMVEQSRRHAFISSLLGIPHVVVCVNKMDLVDWDERVFGRIVADFGEFAAKLDVTDVTFIPISALLGDNVVERSKNMRWYEGPPLLYHLEHLHIASDRNLIDVRFPVQYVIRPRDERYRDYRGYAGQLAAGMLRVGDEVAVLPSGTPTRIASIDTPEGPVDEAFPPMSVTVRLEDELDVSRGDLICRPHNRPHVGRSLEATVSWMSDQPARPGARYLLKHTTRAARAEVVDIRYRIDVTTLHRDESIDELALNDIGRVHLRTSVPVFADQYTRNRRTGAFILIDPASNDTVAAGMITNADEGDVELAAPRPRSANITWHTGDLDRPRRWEALGTRGATIWFTGLSGSGKSTIAAALEERLVLEGQPAYLLDGDNLRHGISGNLGFSADERAENVRRAAEVARLLADAGQVALVSLISPYRADRALARARHDDLDFFEVFVDTDPQECERRDPKGLYAKARSGELKGFTGVDDPYQPPDSPDLVIDGLATPVEEAVEVLVSLLRERGILRT